MGKRTFEEWMKEVDKRLVRATGMDHRDLPDWRYYDDYEDDVTPHRSAARAIKAAKD